MEVLFNASMFTTFNYTEFNSSWVDIYIEPVDREQEDFDYS